MGDNNTARINGPKMGRERSTMKTKVNNTNDSRQQSADLQRQREYIKELEDKGFNYGLVLANAFVKGMRDIGYKSTAFALNEHIDNAIQAGARNIHVAFGYASGNASEKKPDMIAVVDDGHGMDPLMIRASVIWGGTHRHNDRKGFGRYGYGLPSACVSIGRRYTVISKVEGSEWHSVAVDIDEIEDHFQKGHGVVQAPAPKKTPLPPWVAKYIAKHLSTLTAGTVVLIEKVDRLDYTTTRSLSDFLLQEFGITHRNFISEVTIAVNGIAVEPTDPLFLTPGFRFYDVDEDRATALPPLEVEVKDKETKEPLGTIKVRFSLMPPTFLRIPEDKLKPKGGKTNARFKVRKENNGIIVMRAGRQIDVISAKCPWTTFQNNDRYIGIEIDFPPTLDEEFSITTSKQQIVLKPRIWDILEENNVFHAVSEMRRRYDKAAKEIDAKAQDKDGKRPSEAAIEKAQKLFAQAPTELSPKQQQKGEENIQKEAQKLAEHANIPTHEARKLLEAKAKKEPFKVELEDALGAPFYRMEQRGGQSVLKINTAHRFYLDLYASPQSTPHVRYSLEALLFVMGHCELRAKEEREMFYLQERQAWSVNIETTLKALEEWNTSHDMAVSQSEVHEAGTLQEERKQARQVGLA
jgi:histidine kinase/DNA gyrase B/HSP90-like ATPase